MSYNDHVRYTKIINFDRPDPREIEEQKKKEGDYVTFAKKDVNGWRMGFYVNESGKVSISGSRTLGTIDKSGNIGTEATINLTLETTDHRAPLLKIVDSSAYKYDPRFLEIDDQKNRVTESFKKEDQDKFYKRIWPGSSVLTATEFFDEMIPSFEDLLKDTKLSDHIPKIKNHIEKL